MKVKGHHGRWTWDVSHAWTSLNLLTCSWRILRCSRAAVRRPAGATCWTETCTAAPWYKHIQEIPDEGSHYDTVVYLLFPSLSIQTASVVDWCHSCWINKQTHTMTLSSRRVVTFNLFDSLCNSIPKLLSSPDGSPPCLSNIIHPGHGGEGGPVFLLLWCCCSPSSHLYILGWKQGLMGIFPASSRVILTINRSVMIASPDCSALTCSLSPVAPPHLVLADCLSSTWQFLSPLF